MVRRRLVLPRSIRIGPVVARSLRALVGYQRGVNRRLSMRRLLRGLFRRAR